VPSLQKARRSHGRKPRENEQARPDELGDDSGQIGPDSAGQSGDPERLSHVEDANDERVEELSESLEERVSGDRCQVSAREA
jgi:hypothetical protein